MFLIVEDDRLQARSLARFFSQFGEVVIAYTLGQARVALKRHRNIAMVLLDVQLEQECGLDLLPELASRLPEILSVVHTGEAKSDETAQIALAYDARYLPKPAPDGLLRTLVDLATDKRSDRQRYIDVLIRQWTLAKNQGWVLHLSARGYSQSQIADRMSISVSTVVTHRKRITEKSGMKSFQAILDAIDGKFPRS
jgi:DNA-binding NarL/FixJ family response regulator